MSLPYATALAAHLAESRRAGLTFDAAWKRAVAAVPPDTSDCFPWPMDYTRRVMRNGYNRVGGAGIAALAERERLYKDPTLTAPVAVERRCGWGGEPRCMREAREGGWLCEEHAAIVRAIDAKPWSDWGRSRAVVSEAA